MKLGEIVDVKRLKFPAHPYNPEDEKKRIRNQILDELSNLEVPLTIDSGKAAEIIGSFLIEGEGIDETEIADSLKSKAGEIIIPTNQKEEPK